MFIFDVTGIIGYHDYTEFTSSEKIWFDSEKKKLFDRYHFMEHAVWKHDTENYNSFRKEYRKLRQDIIRDVIHKFREFLPERCLIYEFGSLTKFTDRIESDTDLTFCYDEKKNELYECVEELIDYAVVYVFEHSIDHIHGKFQHYPMIHDYDDLTEEDNLYILQFDEGQIKYHCGPETLAENLMHIKNVRDYHSLIEGYREKYMLRCNIDCLYSIEILENSTEHDFLSDLAELEEQNDIFLTYQYLPKTYAFGENIEISCLKRAFKGTIVDMYIMIAYLRKKLKWLKQYSMMMDDVFHSEKLTELFGKSYMEQWEEYLTRMLFYWDKIELLLKKNTVLLSTRCHRHYTKQKLNVMLYEEYHEMNLMENILDSINALRTVITNGWGMLHEKFE